MLKTSTLIDRLGPKILNITTQGSENGLKQRNPPVIPLRLITALFFHRPFPAVAVSASLRNIHSYTIKRLIYPSLFFHIIPFLALASKSANVTSIPKAIDDGPFPRRSRFRWPLRDRLGHKMLNALLAFNLSTTLYP